MKEIDFIPEWYKADRRRRQRYIHQCTLLSIVFACMVVWSFVIGRHVSRVQAEMNSIQAAFEQGKVRIEQAHELERQIAAMEEKTRLLGHIAPRTKISALMGEISYLAGGNILLGRLCFQNEPLQSPKSVLQSSGAVVQTSTALSSQSSEHLQMPFRTKITMTGIAVSGADAAGLISALEKSDYFEQVAPIFTRAKKMGDAEMIEFEIRCYVADYKIQE